MATNPFQNFFGQRQGAGALVGLGSGLLSGNWGNIGPQVMAGQAADDAYATQKKAESERERQLAEQNALKSKYADFFTQHGQPEWAQAVGDGLVTPGDAWSQWMQGKQPQTPIKVGEGETLLDPKTYQPLYSSPKTPDQKDAFGYEKDLWGQYSGSDPVKTYEAVKGGYERVRQGAALNTGAGDMALIYGVMRMNDPGSVVRESEFALAAQSGSYGEQIQGLVNQIINGQRLTPSQRKAFVDMADKLYQEGASNLSDINAQFTQRANQYGVNPTSFIRSPETYQPLTNIADPLGIRQ